MSVGMKSVGVKSANWTKTISQEQSRYHKEIDSVRFDVVDDCNDILISNRCRVPEALELPKYFSLVKSMDVNEKNQTLDVLYDAAYPSSVVYKVDSENTAFNSLLEHWYGTDCTQQEYAKWFFDCNFPNKGNGTTSLLKKYEVSDTQNLVIFGKNWNPECVTQLEKAMLNNLGDCLPLPPPCGAIISNDVCPLGGTFGVFSGTIVGAIVLTTVVSATLEVRRGANSWLRTGATGIWRVSKNCWRRIWGPGVNPAGEDHNNDYVAIDDADVDAGANVVGGVNAGGHHAE